MDPPTIIDRYSNFDGVVAIDGKDFLRSNQKTSFRGVIGAAIVFEEQENFLTDYLYNWFPTLKEDYGIKSKLSVMKSYRILSELGQRKGNEFLEDCFNHIVSSASEISIYHTTIPSTKIPKVKKYWKDRGGIVEVAPVDYLKELQSAYSHTCAWRYVNDHGVEKDKLILIDFFQGEVTPAWEVVRRIPSFNVGADETNPFIAAADIVSKVVDNRLYKNHEFLNYEGIKTCFPEENVGIEFLDNLEFIVPMNRQKIDVSDYLLRPMVFVLKEGIETVVVGKVTESKMIENSPSFEDILNFASELGTQYKFFDANVDMKLIREGDYFIYFGKKGKGTVEYLQSLGYDVKGKHIKELKKL